VSGESRSEEEFGIRPYPRCPYTPSKAVLEISPGVLTATFKAHTSFAKRKVESCCFWYGTISEKGHGRVQAVVIPAQRNTWGNYHVRSEAMAAVSAATRRFGLRNLVQIHTHPGRLVEHSFYDDRMANSRQALSLVLPNYGAPRCRWPDEVGIHEFQQGYWYRLGIEYASKRVAVVSDYGTIQILDLRPR